MPNATSALMDLLEKSPNVFRPYYLFAAPGMEDYDLVGLWHRAKATLGLLQEPTEEQLEQGASDALTIVKALCHYWAADGLAVDLLSSWREYEELAYFSSRDYRDHFLHQFYVFLVGLALLGHGLIGSTNMRDSVMRLRDEWEESTDPRYRTRDIQRQAQGLRWAWDQRDFLDTQMTVRLFRRWMLAACFHDLGYAAENLTALSRALNQNFFSKVPGYSIPDFTLQAEPYLEGTLQPILERLAALLLWDEWLPLGFPVTGDEVKRSLLPTVGIFRAGMEERDHGVMSAVFFLLTMMADLQELPIRLDVEDAMTAIMEDIYVAGLAIALHNLRKTTYPGLLVNYAYHPVSFMLMLSDELQEWDRTPFNTDLWDHLEHIQVETLGAGSIAHPASPFVWRLDFRFRSGTHPDQAKQSRFWHNLESLTTHNLAAGPSLRVDIDGQHFFQAYSQRLPTGHWPVPVRPSPNPDYFVSEPRKCRDPYCRKCQRKRRSEPNARVG